MVGDIGVANGLLGSVGRSRSVSIMQALAFVASVFSIMLVALDAGPSYVGIWVSHVIA